MITMTKGAGTMIAGIMGTGVMINATVETAETVETVEIADTEQKFNPVCNSA